MSKIDKKIFRLYEKIGEEIRLIEQVKNYIDGKNIDEKDLDKENDFFSYYDLLSFLKRRIIFKKVSLNEFWKEIFYIYNYEGNYIIEDKAQANYQFTLFLGEFDSDDNKFKKNIRIIKN